MTDLLDAFLAHKDHLSTHDLPASVASAVKTFTVDTLAVGIAGAAAPLTGIVRSAAVPWGGRGSAPLFGPGGLTCSAGSAAFVNAFQIHCQEYDCVHEPAVVHPMATIFAALTADCAGRNETISGLSFIKAIALGVDMAANLGVAAVSPIRFFRPANAGLFGATLGISFLRELTKKQTCDALGYALSFNAGTMQAHVEGKPALPIQIAHAARASIMACDLAEAGMPGTRDSLEGPFGYFSLFETEVDHSGLAATLGDIYRITEVSHKPFPTGRAAQGGISLCQDIHAIGLDPQDIEAIELSAPPIIERLVGRALTDDLTANYARLCFAYVGAVALLRGNVTLQDFDEESLKDERVLDIGRRITVSVNDVADPAAFAPQTLTITTKNGETHTRSTDRLYGAPNQAMSIAAQREKVEGCLAFAHGRVVKPLADELWQCVDQLDKIRDINEMTRMASSGDA